MTLNSGNYEILPGKPYPLGATVYPDGTVNFAVAAKEVKKISLVFYSDDNKENSFLEVSLHPPLHKTGNVWHALVRGLPPFTIYGYRTFSSSKTDASKEDSYLLLDPYAKLVSGGSRWEGGLKETYHPLGKIVSSPSTFDWEGDTYLNIPKNDLIIYEMHVRGFTRDPSSKVAHPGTFLGMIEKIPYLKKLGINAVELLPIYEFNEGEVPFTSPKTGERLCNYFGYSTVNFFSPMLRYATQSDADRAIIECKTMIREFHKNGIAVILDVVYNHTFEGGGDGPILSFRGLDHKAYYMVDSSGNYLNFSGCGNTVNGNHPLVIDLILDSLRYWVVEMHVDGFRFDLASIFTRLDHGAPIARAPLVEAISLDPILSDTLLIAEAWDAAGLYQVGGFYPGSRWSEWNGRYRDVVRRFIKGDSGQKTAFATALCGSQDLYGWRKTPLCSINYVIAHDGFSLNDLVSYNEKHNLDNGENNQDGFNHNDSWNCGVEGYSADKKITLLRERQMRNFHLALMVSQGIPMFVMGDEYGHTRKGNNNTWCQDNELNWFLWNLADAGPQLHRYFSSLLHFRKMHAVLRQETFLTEEDITWHGVVPYQPGWENDNGLVAFTLHTKDEPDLFIAFNAAHAAQSLSLPLSSSGKPWRWVVNTHNPSPQDFFEEGARPVVASNMISLYSYSAIMLKSE